MIRNDPHLGQGLTLEGWSLACPTGTSHGDKHNLSQWDRQITQLVPVGQAVLVPTGTGKGQKRPLLVPKRPLLVPWDKSYIHAGGLSLSCDKLYTHDEACPSSTCPNLSHKVGLQGRGKLYNKNFPDKKFLDKSSRNSFVRFYHVWRSVVPIFKKCPEIQQTSSVWNESKYHIY